MIHKLNVGVLHLWKKQTQLIFLQEQELLLTAEMLLWSNHGTIKFEDEAPKTTIKFEDDVSQLPVPDSGKKEPGLLEKGTEDYSSRFDRRYCWLCVSRSGRTHRQGYTERPVFTWPCWKSG
jgi:hypothetical protein